ncbi:hypothetical protein [Coleofasciculus sp. G2-EDA-02]
MGIKTKIRHKRCFGDNGMSREVIAPLLAHYPLNQLISDLFDKIS